MSFLKHLLDIPNLDVAAIGLVKPDLQFSTEMLFGKNWNHVDIVALWRKGEDED